MNFSKVLHLRIYDLMYSGLNLENILRLTTKIKTLTLDLNDNHLEDFVEEFANYEGLPLLEVISLTLDQEY